MPPFGPVYVDIMATTDVEKKKSEIDEVKKADAKMDAD